MVLRVVSTPGTVLTMTNPETTETPPDGAPARTVTRTTVATQWHRFPARFEKTQEWPALVAAASALNVSVNDYMRDAVFEKIERDAQAARTTP